MFNKLINRLPDNYAKNKDSINGKLYQIYANELQQVKKAFEDIKLSQDMDNATHATLDKIGKNVLELRNSDDDNVYRQFIKTKIIANLSHGDIETLNTVADFLLGDNFLGFRETWNIKAYEDIAGLVGEFKMGLASIPSILNRVKAGGVKLYWEATAVDHLIKIKSQAREGSSIYPLCNEWEAGTWWYQQNVGRLKESDIVIKAEIKDTEFTYPETALIASSEEYFAEHLFANQLTIEQAIKIDSIIRDVNFDYIKVNEILGGEYPDIMNTVKSIRNKLGIENGSTMGEIGYPVSGDTITKEGE